MAGSVEALRQAVRSNFQGVSNWVDFESSFEQAYKQALNYVNLDVPRYRTVLFTGNGTGTYVLDQSVYWDTESSRVVSVEYPIDEKPRTYLDDEDDYFIFEDEDGVVTVEFVSITVATSSSFRAVVTSNHTFTDESSTLGNQAYQAMIVKTSELICLQMQARLNFTSNPLIDADTVQFNDKPKNFAKLATMYAEEYKRFVGLSDDVKAAHAMSDADIKAGGNMDYTWHPKRYR